MMNLIKSDFKKICYLPGYRKFLVLTIALSILFGAVFLFTIGFTQGKQLTDLTFMEVIDVSFLGADVSNPLLALFPENALHTFINIHPANDSLASSVIILLAWIIISSFIGLWKFRRIDY